MAWTTPKSWTSSMVTATIMNAQIKANFDTLSAHAHSGAAGNGSATLAGPMSFAALPVTTLADQSASPTIAGRLQRNGNNLEYYGSALRALYANAAAGTPSLRSLGTGSTQASAGNHTHT